MAEDPRFDPLGILAALDRQRVSYVVIRAFARVIHGADEVTRGLDIVPSMREENLRRLDAALEDLGGARLEGRGRVGCTNSIIARRTRVGDRAFRIVGSTW